MRLGNSRAFAILILVLFSLGPLLFAQLPSGWSDTDVGTVGKVGSASYANGVFTVQGAGTGLTSGTADGFHFVYQPVSGNGSIIARVVSEPVGATAGVMVRQTLAAGSVDAETIDYTNSGTSGYVYFDLRATTGGNLSSISSAYVSLPYWVQLAWSGSTFSSYRSADGVNWVQVGSSQTISMTGTVDVGLAVTSASTSTLDTATFDNVSLNLSGTPAPVITSV